MSKTTPTISNNSSNEDKIAKGINPKSQAKINTTKSPSIIYVCVLWFVNAGDESATIYNERTLHFVTYFLLTLVYNCFAIIFRLQNGMLISE